MNRTDQDPDGPERSDSEAAQERERRATHAVNQRIFETSLDLILVVDSRGNFIRVSPSSEAILGYRPEELAGRNAVDYLYPEDLENTRQEMRLARRGQEMRNFVTRYVHKDGRIVTLMWTGVWSEPERQHFFIGRDMTEHLAAEERLQRSQRLEAVGQLTGGIAHDFNNLLLIAIGSLDQVHERLNDDPKAASLVDSAQTALFRGAELTRQLLAFARRQPLDAKATDVNERISTINEWLRRTLGEQIEFATELAPDLWPALVDPTQLESALVNLAINARDAMPGGGRLIIETENKSLDERYSDVNPEAAPGDYVMIAISDNGMGMGPDVLEKVFDPFFTTKEPGEGTGLGLSMVYGFARQSYGHVKVYSEIGHGTTVRLYLPRSDALSPSAAPTAAPSEGSGGGGGERILVVEDDPDVRQVVVFQLRDLGYRVIEAGNGASALAVIERGEAVDLLFTDLIMPGGMSGTDLVRAARKIRPGLKVLATSGFAQGSMHGGLAEHEINGLLNKPYRKADLAAKLRRIFDGAR